MLINKKAFTLIELLVVVLIIGILAAIALPQYQKTVEKSRFSEALTLIGTLGRAQEFYKLATGSPSLTFANFDVTISHAAPSDTVTGGLGHASGGVLAGQYFDYVINSHNNSFWYGAITIIRSSGKYKYGGFVYSNGQIYCIEGGGSPTAFCKNMYNATLYQINNAGWDLYKLP
jgi:prepilin-type N-terminal cleavage/methylation domain-containing protein